MHGIEVTGCIGSARSPVQGQVTHLAALAVNLQALDSAAFLSVAHLQQLIIKQVRFYKK